MAAHVEGVGGHEPLPLPIKHSESILPARLGSMHNIPDTSYGLNTLRVCVCVFHVVSQCSLVYELVGKRYRENTMLYHEEDN